MTGVQTCALPIYFERRMKNGVEEDFDSAEYDDEAGMSHNSLHTIMRATKGLEEVIQQGDNLPEWCQEKLSIAEDYLVTVWDYLQSEQGLDEEKQRLDPKCWKGYKKAGTKMKGDVRVNNCVPVKEERMSAAVRMQRALEREKQKRERAERAGQELLNPKKDKEKTDSKSDTTNETKALRTKLRKNRFRGVTTSTKKIGRAHV